MKGKKARLQRIYTEELAKAAYDYLDIGLNVFYETQDLTTFGSRQVAVANLAIAVELMLKAFIATQNLALLFVGLPIGARLLLVTPATLPSNFQWRVPEIELRSPTSKLIDLGECAAIFLVFFSEQRPALKTNLDSLVVARNASVHSFLPAIQEYEVERAAYTSLAIYRILLSRYPLLFLGHERDDERDEKFLASFEETLVKNMREKLHVAEEKAKQLHERLKLEPASLPLRESAEYWTKHIGRCPVCDGDVILDGFTDIAKDEANEDGPEREYLGFYPEGLHCTSCDLLLDSYGELKLTAANHLYERDEDIEEYLSAMKRFEDNESSG